MNIPTRKELDAIVDEELRIPVIDKDRLKKLPDAYLYSWLCSAHILQRPKED